MEDASHTDALGCQSIVGPDCLLRLQHLDVNAVLLEVLDCGRENLEREG